MKIPSNNKYLTKKIVISILLLLAVFGLIAAVMFIMHINPFTTNKNMTTLENSSINFDSPTDEEIEAGTIIKKDSLENTDKSDTNQEITVSLEAIQNGDKVVFSTLIQAISNNGNCSLTITSNNETVTETSDVFANPSSSSCKGFSVETSRLPKGLWVATLTVNIGSSKGVNTTNINIE